MFFKEISRQRSLHKFPISEIFARVFYKGSPRKVSARGFLARSSCHKTSCTGFVQKPCALMHNTFAWPFAQRFDSYPVHLRCFAVGHGLTRSVISRQNVYSHLIFQQFSEYSCAEIPAHVRFQTTRQRDTCAKKKCDDAISHFHRHQVPLLTPLHSQNECSGEKGRKKQNKGWWTHIILWFFLSRHNPTSCDDTAAARLTRTHHGNSRCSIWQNDCAMSAAIQPRYVSFRVVWSMGGRGSRPCKANWRFATNGECFVVTTQSLAEERLSTIYVFSIRMSHTKFGWMFG